MSSLVFMGIEFRSLTSRTRSNHNLGSKQPVAMPNLQHTPASQRINQFLILLFHQPVWFNVLFLIVIINQKLKTAVVFDFLAVRRKGKDGRSSSGGATKGLLHLRVFVAAILEIAKS